MAKTEKFMRGVIWIFFNTTKKRSLLMALTLLMPALNSQGTEPPSCRTIIYLFPGQGADYRQFRDIKFPPEYDTVHISYPVPEDRESMSEFAYRFIPMIDQTIPFVLLGVSLGGMICTELADTLHPEETILISSAKSRYELPGHYTFMRKFRFNRIIPKGLVKAGARVLQGIVEPDRKYDPDTFKDMLKKKDALYLKRTADMIVSWERETYPEAIVHVHGTADHTIPFKHVKCDFIVDEGSHMMVLSKADEISELIGLILSWKCTRGNIFEKSLSYP